MSTTDKILKKMRHNPRDWRIEHFETVARQYGVAVHKRGGSHVVFDHPGWVELFCVPAKRPIKPIYVKKFVALIETLENPNEEN